MRHDSTRKGTEIKDWVEQTPTHATPPLPAATAPYHQHHSVLLHSTPTKIRVYIHTTLHINTHAHIPSPTCSNRSILPTSNCPSIFNQIENTYTHANIHINTFTHIPSPTCSNRSREPTPHCPSLFKPHENISGGAAPEVRSTSVWLPPHATSRCATRLACYEGMGGGAGGLMSG